MIIKKVGDWVTIGNGRSNYFILEHLVKGYVGTINRDPEKQCDLLELIYRMRRMDPELEEPTELLKRLWPYKKPSFASVLREVLKKRISE